jgi:hypothetical protein
MHKLYLVRHAESCSNIVRDDISTLHDKPKKFKYEDKFLSKGLFDENVMKQLRSHTDKNGEYTSFHYHPSLSFNGVKQADKLKNVLNESNMKEIKADILENANTIYISSATLRTVMTALLVLQDKVKEEINKESTAKKLLTICPHINEAISSKVKEFIKENPQLFKTNEKWDADKIETFLKTDVRADVGIPHEIIKEVIHAGIKWLIRNNYLDVANSDDVMNLIDFDYYIQYCKTDVIEKNINPYLQNVKAFKDCLKENKDIPIDSIFVLFVHFKVILHELKEKGKQGQADDGDNASIWLETTDANFKLEDINLKYEGPKIREDDHDLNFLKSEDESICYVNDNTGDEFLTYNINKLYDTLLSNDNSTLKFIYTDKSIINLEEKPKKHTGGRKKYKTKKVNKKRTRRNKKQKTKRMRKYK